MGYAEAIRGPNPLSWRAGDVKTPRALSYKPGMPEAPEAGERPGTIFLKVLPGTSPAHTLI